jgi:hypothetical protein
MAVASFTRLRPIPYPSAQEQSSEVLLYGARADVQLRSDLLVAAALDEQLQNLLVARRDLNVAQV